jgi:hypothetical protein
LREYSTPLLFNHSHRVFFWARELGRRANYHFDEELLFVCAAFHDRGLLRRFSSEQDRFEVDSANAVRQFLEHHQLPEAQIQVAWDAIALHTTPGIAAYKPVEVELLYNGVGLDVLGIGYQQFPEDVRARVVAEYPAISPARSSRSAGCTPKARARTGLLRQVTITMSDRGIPRSYRHMHGFGSHTYSFINARNERIGSNSLSRRCRASRI